jgi:hypothetical protein
LLKSDILSAASTLSAVDIAYESFPGNFRPVNGVMMPFSLNQKMNGRSMLELTVEKVEVNTPMDDSIFQMPEKSSLKK